MAQRYQGGILGVGFNPLQAPNAPTIGAASINTATAVSVAFTAPANVGGSAISSYAVRVSPGNISASGASSPITVSGLTTGTAYTFSVSALNSYGPSPYSGTVTATPFLAVEDVFSTFLYVGNNSTQTITNGVNLSGQGGLVWTKGRSVGAFHVLIDTARGASSQLFSNTSDAAQSGTDLSSFSTTGYVLGAPNNANMNSSGNTFVSWTFCKAPKFFDIVTYTGDGSSSRSIAHSLGVAPGMIIVRRIDSIQTWFVYHRSLGFTSGYPNYLALNADSAQISGSVTLWNAIPTSTAFTIGSSPGVNASGGTYVAYLYAHDTASDGIIQCGATPGGGGRVNLGWEPQWVLVKNRQSIGNWTTLDTMRGLPIGNLSGQRALFPNLADVETNASIATQCDIDATGFTLGGNDVHVYVAIRRGPMKTPTVGTSVFNPFTYTGNGTTQSIGTLQAADVAFMRPYYTTSGVSPAFFDRLRGNGIRLLTPSTAAEGVNAQFLQFTNSMSVTVGTDTEYNANTATNMAYLFKRAPGFMDEVCYNGQNTEITLNHNLGVAPELIIVKTRTPAGYDWYVQSSGLASATASYLVINKTDAVGTSTGLWGSVAPTATQFRIGGGNNANTSGRTYVAYLFASCPGVSKVGTYTGNGSSQTINCGFTTGARFFLVKRTNAAGDWYFWDSARGIVAASDPALAMNTTAGPISVDAVDADNSGIIVNQEASLNINVNGGTYIFLAIS